SQAGVFHVMSRIIDRRLLLVDRDACTFFMQILRAYEELLGVEVITHCLMGNHFHLLLRVPHRPEGFDLPLETLVARLERAVGAECFSFIRRDLEFWERTGNAGAIEEWRQRQLARMFSLSEFVRCLKQRFTWWHNRRTGREGTLWERRFTSVIVEDAERALRTVAAYIDLNPVRAGLVSDPGDYEWSGYGEAMRGGLRARRGVVRIIGQMAWPRATAAQARPWGPDAFPATVGRRALVMYRALLGGQGREKRAADGTLLRRGLSEKARNRLTTPDERLLRAEILTRRIRHFSRGVILGSREFVDGWFSTHRDICRGKSRTDRQTGARSLGRPALRGLYSFRNPVAP
ncbi:MAG: transposase, partial [Verrucomicrobiales bacterium]|nr:transposase [Verrucomicrobiales bacterium]